MSQTLVKPINSDSEFGLPPTFILKVYDPRFYFFRSKSPTRRNPEFNDFYISKEDDYVGWEEYLLSDCQQFYYESSAYIRLASCQS